MLLMSVPLLITVGYIIYFIAGDTPPVIDCMFMIKRFSVVDYAVRYSLETTIRALYIHA
jgi:hypothetical protein